MPSANDLIDFQVDGGGAIAAVDSADNSSHEPFQSHQRRAFQGECFAIVKVPPGKRQIQLRASADNVKPASLTITGEP